MSYKPIRSVDYLVVHCAATKSTMDIGATEIRRWHKERGWFDIGYHYVIRRDGDVEKGRPDDQPGAHARGFNHNSLGICLVGGVGKDGKTAENNFTPEQFAALAVLLNQLLGFHPHALILGHRDLPNVAKACPSFDVREWWTEQELHHDHCLPTRDDDVLSVPGREAGEHAAD